MSTRRGHSTTRSAGAWRAGLPLSLLTAAVALLLLRCGTRTGLPSDLPTRADAGTDDRRMDAAVDHVVHNDAIVCATGEASVQVSPRQLVGVPVRNCPEGQAHPTVCCEGNGYRPTCTENPEAPFRSCPEGAFMFPDPVKCCSLTDERACGPAPPDSGAVAPDAACYELCPPGFFAPEYNPPSFYPCEAGLPGADGDVCSCDAASCCTGLDLEAAGGGALECLSYGLPCAGSDAACSLCPEGWEPRGPNSLCCRSAPCGDECFSTVTGITGTAFGYECGFKAGTCDCLSYDEYGDSLTVICQDGGCACARGGVVIGTIPEDPTCPGDRLKRCFPDQDF